LELARRLLYVAQRGIALGRNDMTRILTLLGLLTAFTVAVACSDKSDKPGSSASSGGEKVEKAADDAADSVEEGAEDVGDKVEEATE
jgi:hypothetical protein